MQLGVYSITYLGVWYEGEALGLEPMMRLLRKQGWEAVQFDTKRPHASPMDLDADARKRLRNLAGELDLPIVAVAPNTDLSGHRPEHLEAEICYTRACIELARDLGAPYCKIFTEWPGVVVRDGLADYKWTFSLKDPFVRWQDEKMDIAVKAVGELARFAADQNVTLVLQNHGSVTGTRKEVFELIDRVDSPALKPCIDLPHEPDACVDPEKARALGHELAKQTVLTQYYCDFTRNENGEVELQWEKNFAYPAFVRGLIEGGYDGAMLWEFCHILEKDGRRVGIDAVHEQTEMALEYMKRLRAEARAARG